MSNLKYYYCSDTLLKLFSILELLTNVTSFEYKCALVSKILPYYNDNKSNLDIKKYISKNRIILMTKSRSSTILPVFCTDEKDLGIDFLVHSGRGYAKVLINSSRLYKKLGSFSYTKKEVRHKKKDNKNNY